jgi:hypothetical protein
MSNYYKAFIKVVKSLNNSYGEYFGNTEVVREPLIIAESKKEVKDILIEKYPDFFQNGKVYEKETKDKAQFFYVVIFELYQYEKDMVIENKSWECSYCKHIHENRYISRPLMHERLFGSDVMFCRGNEPGEGDFGSNHCMNEYKKRMYEGVELPDDEHYINKDSLNYIYKITEKETNKSYIGKTRNAVFFRWWNHLKHSSSPFGIYLNSRPLSDFTFEVLEVLPAGTIDTDIFRIETEYMMKFDSIANGFNTVASNKLAQAEYKALNDTNSLFNQNDIQHAQPLN